VQAATASAAVSPKMVNLRMIAPSCRGGQSFLVAHRSRSRSFVLLASAEGDIGVGSDRRVDHAGTLASRGVERWVVAGRAIGVPMSPARIASTTRVAAPSATASDPSSPRTIST